MLGHFYESFKIARVRVLALLPVPIPIISVKIMKRMDAKQKGGFRYFLKDRELIENYDPTFKLYQHSCVMQYTCGPYSHQQSANLA